MSQKAKYGRNAEMADYYKQGFSMRETALAFDISLERVRAILRQHFPRMIRPAHNTCNNSTGLSSSARRSALSPQERDK